MASYYNESDAESHDLEPLLRQIDPRNTKSRLNCSIIVLCTIAFLISVSALFSRSHTYHSTKSNTPLGLAPWNSTSLVVHVYAPTFPWIEQHSFADLLRYTNKDGKRIVYRWRKRSIEVFEKDFAVAKDKGIPLPCILVCDLRCESEWEGYIDTHSTWTKQHMGLIHFSDENNNSDYPSRIYKHFAYVFRNYIRPDIQQDVLYVLDDAKDQEIIDWTRLAQMVWMMWSIQDHNCPVISSSTDWRSGFPSELLKNTSLVQQTYSNFIALSLGEREAFHSHVSLCWEAAHSQFKYVDVNSEADNQHLIADGLVSWFPLGYGTDVVIDSITQNSLPTSRRPLLFGWAGDVAFKPERVEAFDGLVKATTNTISTSVHRLFTEDVVIMRAQGFHQPMLELLHYTQLMLDSRFLPTPAGGSAEQFRIWEALYHHVHPIVLQKHVQDTMGGPLQYLVRLGLGPILLENWADLQSVLMQLEMMPPSILDRWQNVRKARLESIVENVKKRIYERVIAVIDP